MSEQHYSKISCGVIITLLLMLPLLSSDIYLPALPVLAHSFSVGPAAAQATISYYLLGYALGNLFYGALSDTFGRKKLLIVGLTVYVIATIFCLTVSRIEMFQILRLVQGIGVCAASVLGRVIIMDVYRDRAARIFTIVFPLAACSPIIAPPIGGYLTNLFASWQPCFIVLLCLGGGLLISVIWKLPESLPTTARIPLKLKHVIENYCSLLQHKIFWGYSLIFVSSYLAWFIYIVETPFIFHGLSIPPDKMGLLYIPLSLSFLLGNLCFRYLSRRLSTKMILMMGMVIFIVAAGLYVGLSFHPPFILGVLGPMLVVTFANGSLTPFSTYAALSIQPKLKSSSYGASIIGFLQLSIGALATFVLVHAFRDHFAVLSYSVVVIAVCIVIGVWLAYWSFRG